MLKSSKVVKSMEDLSPTKENVDILILFSEISEHIVQVLNLFLYKVPFVNFMSAIVAESIVLYLIEPVALPETSGFFQPKILNILFESIPEKKKSTLLFFLGS